MLCAMRREHEISLPRVRTALNYLRRRLGSRHPLADQHFETDGMDLFVERYGELINASRQGQLALRALLQASLRRIERDASGNVIRLYPYTRIGSGHEPRVVVIDPLVSFGRPVLTGTGIPTSVVAERFTAGESVEDLARDYGRNGAEIEEAIRCELGAEAA